MPPWVWLVNQTLAIAMLALGIWAGVVVSMGAIEDFAKPRRYFEFEGFKYGVGLLVALIGYVGRKLALDDVNSVFHIDPGPLPMTVWAATALNLMAALLILFFFLGMLAATAGMVFSPKNPSAASSNELLLMSGHWTCAAFKSAKWRWIKQDFLYAKLRWVKDSPRRRAVERFVPCLAVMFSAIAGIMVVEFHLSEDRRQGKIYMVALATDFNTNFHCAEFNSFGLAGLFIGPDQREVMVARIYEEDVDPKNPFKVGMKKPPEQFPKLRCTPPPVKLDEWKRENHVKEAPPIEIPSPRLDPP